jgi:hypothetical protein
VNPVLSKRLLERKEETGTRMHTDHLPWATIFGVLPVEFRSLGTQTGFSSKQTEQPFIL